MSGLIPLFISEIPLRETLINFSIQLFLLPFLMYLYPVINFLPPDPKIFLLFNPGRCLSLTSTRYFAHLLLIT